MAVLTACNLVGEPFEGWEISTYDSLVESHMETEKNEEILYLVFSSLLLIISLFQVVVLFLQEQSCSDPKPKTHGGQKKAWLLKLKVGLESEPCLLAVFTPNSLLLPATSTLHPVMAP